MVTLGIVNSTIRTRPSLSKRVVNGEEPLIDSSKVFIGERGFCKGNKSDAIFQERRNPVMTNRTFRQATTLIIVAGFTVFLFAPDLFGNDERKPFDRKTEIKLESLVDHTMKEIEVPGVIVGVWTPGGQWIRAKGFADLKTKRESRVTDLFRIGSTTKPFTATVILQLADEGKFRLDDTIDRFDFGIKIPDSDKITIRHLLNHTSSLFDFGDDEKFFIPYIKNLTRKWTTKELLEFSLSHPRYGAPGEKFHYSNTNFVLLSLMIEQKTGNRLDKEMTQRIFKPLGLKNTYLPEGTGIKGMHTHGYMKTKEGKFLDTTPQDLSWKWAQGGIISNLEDLRRLEDLDSGARQRNTDQSCHA
jgi:CubicO group peptidase (beta-lactamase class C family)